MGAEDKGRVEAGEPRHVEDGGEKISLMEVRYLLAYIPILIVDPFHSVLGTVGDGTKSDGLQVRTRVLNPETAKLH